MFLSSGPGPIRVDLFGFLVLFGWKAIRQRPGQLASAFKAYGMECFFLAEGSRSGMQLG